jgi:hypothetical protein
VLVESRPFMTILVAFHFPINEVSLNPQVEVDSSLPQDNKINSPTDNNVIFFIFLIF